MLIGSSLGTDPCLIKWKVKERVLSEVLLNVKGATS